MGAPDTSLPTEADHIPAEAGGTLGVRPRLPDPGNPGPLVMPPLGNYVGASSVK